MKLPTRMNIHLPLLKTLEENGGSLPIREAITKTKEKYKLTEEAMASNLASGQNRLNNRIEWARMDLVSSGDLDGSKTGIWTITNKGRETLKIEWPGWKAEYIELKERGVPNKKGKLEGQNPYDNESPSEILDQSVKDIIDTVKNQLLETLKGGVTPTSFENIVAQLLERLEYGNIADGSIKVTGRSGDGGIDGVCSMDKLGLLKVLFQAKRWTNNISSHDVRDFIGAMHNARANFGVFITTSDYSSDARKEAAKAGNLKLINGEELASLMINTELGVRSNSLLLPKLDRDYFDGLL